MFSFPYSLIIEFQPLCLIELTITTIVDQYEICFSLPLVPYFSWVENYHLSLPGCHHPDCDDIPF